MSSAWLEAMTAGAPDAMWLAGSAASGWLARALISRRRSHCGACDPLTGVATRAGWMTYAQAALDQRDVAVVFIDLDRFKTLNDTYGHAAGDAVLVAVAARLVGHAGQSRSVCRLGGDEFAVLLPHRGDDVASELSGLHRSLCTPVPWRGQLVAVGASVGGALAVRRTSIAAALERADSAMYAAKRAGGGIRVAGPRVPGVAAGATSRVRRWEAVA